VMMTTAYILFFLSLFLLVYTFAGYPLLMLCLGWRKRTVKTEKSERKVTLLICAYNEEKVIGDKIANSLALDYPKDRLEIIVVSDGSSDRTNQIMNSYSDQRLTCLTYADRGGKVKALNTGMAIISGDIVVLTDANVMLEPDAITKLTAVFADDTVGCAVGNTILRSPDGAVSGEGIYSRYEKRIHRSEENFRTMITVDGALYAIRREFVLPLPPDTITDDWFMATGVLGRGKRIVYVADAIGYEDAAESVAGEFKRKVRMIAGGYQSLFRRAGLFLNPFRYPAIAFMIVSHKLLRWTAMIFMLWLLISTIFLTTAHPFFVAFALCQILFYLLALIGRWGQKGRVAIAFYLPYYFTAVNWAALVGLWKYLSGGQKVTWARGRG
jgi:poly-beta-1,6-N-acetyl-D-glucosamine synthase